MPATSRHIAVVQRTGFRVQWCAVLLIGGCTLAPRGFVRSQHLSTVTTLPNGESVVIGAALHGDFRRAPIHLDARGRWSRGPKGPDGSGHTAALLSDGRILICGGLTGALKSAGVHLYNPSARTWRSASPMHTARLHAAAVTLGDGRVPVHGGGYDEPKLRDELYDPSTDRWKTVPAAEACRDGHLAALRDGRALLMSDDCAALFDSATERWTQANAPRHRHRGGSATVLTDGRVLLVGGNGDAAASRSTELFDPNTNVWTAGPPLTHGRWAHSTTQVGNVLIIAGGRSTGPRSGRRMHSIELFDLRTGQRGRKNLGIRRSGHAVAALPNGDVFLLGGSVGMIFNNFPSHRYARVRLSRRWRKRAHAAPARHP